MHMPLTHSRNFMRVASFAYFAGILQFESFGSNADSFRILTVSTVCCGAWFSCKRWLANGRKAGDFRFCSSILVIFVPRCALCRVHARGGAQPSLKWQSRRKCKRSIDCARDANKKQCSSGRWRVQHNNQWRLSFLMYLLVISEWRSWDTVSHR